MNEIERENNIDTLQELVQVTRDAKEFYEAAARKIEDPALRAEFSKLADAKHKIIVVLTGHIKARGEFAVTDGTFAGSMRRAYGELLGALASREHAAHAYAAQLEETEDKLLRRFEEALDEIKSAQLRELLLPLLPKMRRGHDEMARLKAALDAQRAA
jgi:uncharacterized protein (TIGR02284 family)